MHKDRMQWRKRKAIGLVTAEVVGLHVAECKSVSWHRLLNASQGLPPAAVQQGCSCTALWGNIQMCADKLGPVARGLVVDWVCSRVLLGVLAICTISTLICIHCEGPRQFCPTSASIQMSYAYYSIITQGHRCGEAHLQIFGTSFLVKI